MKGRTSEEEFSVFSESNMTKYEIEKYVFRDDRYINTWNINEMHGDLFIWQNILVSNPRYNVSITRLQWQLLFRNGILENLWSQNREINLFQNEVKNDRAPLTSKSWINGTRYFSVHCMHLGKVFLATSVVTVCLIIMTFIRCSLVNWLCFLKVRINLVPVGHTEYIDELISIYLVFFRRVCKNIM